MDFTKKSNSTRVSEITFLVEPDIDLEISDLLEAFYSKENSKRNEHLIKTLEDLLYDCDISNISFYYKEHVPAAKINVYQAGLIHLSDRSGKNDLEWLDELLNEVIH